LLLCCHQAWIALEASGANYQLEQVSLYGPGGKPDWFWKLNPKGQVPVLVVNEEKEEVILADSDLILDEIQRVMDSSQSQLKDGVDNRSTLLKVQAFRKCMSEFLPIGKKAVLGGSDQQMWSKLQQLDGLIEGPYVAGNQMTVADCAGFPFLWRIQQEYGNVWEDHNCYNIPKWLDHCSAQPAFAKSIQSSWWWWW
jgi:glutathione S-transferase